MECAAQDRSEFAGCSDLVHPFRNRTSEAGQVAGQQRVGDDVAIVLLARGNDERREVGLRVRQRTDGIAHTGGRVQVDERGRAGRHRVALGHANDGRLLQREHVVQIVRSRERVDQW